MSPVPTATLPLVVPSLLPPPPPPPPPTYDRTDDGKGGGACDGEGRIVGRAKVEAVGDRGGEGKGIFEIIKIRVTVLEN